MKRSEIEVRSTAGRKEGREPATEMERSGIEVSSTAGRQEEGASLRPR